MVTIENKVTTRTGEGSCGQKCLLSVSAPRTILASEARIHSDKLTTSVFSFIRKVSYELSPSYIGNRFGKAVIVYHPIDVKVFNNNDTILISDLPTGLMCKIRTPISDTLMDTRSYFASLMPFGSILFKLRHFSLCFGERLFISSKETGIRDRFSSGQGSKGFQSHINSNRLFRFGKRCILNFVDKGCKPFPIRGSPNTASFRSIVKSPMDDSLDSSYLRQDNGMFPNAISTLGIGKTIVPACTPEARIAWFVSCLNTSKECLESKVNSYRHILQDLAMNYLQGSSFIFKPTKGVYLVVQGNRHLPLFPKILALFKKMVIKPATLIKSFDHQGHLLFSWVYAILVGSFMHIFNIAQRCVYCQEGGGTFICRLKADSLLCLCI